MHHHRHLSVACRVPKGKRGKELRRRRKCRWESSEAEGGGGRETVVSAVPFRDRERRRVHAMNASFCPLDSKAHSGAAAPLFRSPLDIVVVRCDGPSFVRRTRNDGRRPRDAWLFCCSLSVLFDPFVRPSLRPSRSVRRNADDEYGPSVRP